MIQAWFYSLISVIVVSFVSLCGVFLIPIKENRYKNILIYLISFATGSLFGDVFIHLLPDIVKKSGFTLAISFYFLAGIVCSFILEKVIFWHHCHMPITKNHVHRFAYMSLFGDFIHNFIDGLIIGASYLAGIPIGIATTVAVVLHEIPQEIGDFAILIHGGFSKNKAIFYNFIVALSAIAGTIASLLLGIYIKGINIFLIPFAAGNLIYIAGSDLIPELHKETNIKNNLFQVISFVFGILIMFSLLLLG